jgi:4-hydroxythreonine-4-phosphate dehydrogenase
MNPPRIGITMGDPKGIGPEVICKAFDLVESTEGLVVYGRPDLFSALEMSCVAHDTAREAIEAAARDLDQGHLDGVVTGPVSKSCFGGDFPGHTELFAERLGAERFAMVLTGERLTVSCVTTHIPLRDVAEVLSIDDIVSTGRLLDTFLRDSKGLERPRLAMAALNPHASDGGLFGDEETRLLEPAISELRAQGVDISGPWSSDTVFHHAVGGRFDGVLCGYHDQALIPFKLLHFSDGVNVTVGLHRPRTSPDHGPAYDLVGRDLADPTIMVRAIEMAQRLARSKPPNLASAALGCD